MRAQVESLDARVVPGSVHYHLVPLAGRGLSVQTSSIAATTGGGYQIVDLIHGRASDLGPFSGAITYSVGPKGGPISGMGVIHAIHQYELTFVLSGSVSTTSPSSQPRSETFIFDVTGGTKRFAFAKGQGQILATNASNPFHTKFRIKALLEQLT